ncbi:hypothetical protein GCM10027261_43360 [Geodermatophilus arenarius]
MSGTSESNGAETCASPAPLGAGADRAVHGVGTGVAAQLLVTAGDNPSGCAPRPPAPNSATLRHYRAAVAAPSAIGSTAAGTGTPTAPCTSSLWSGCRLTKRLRAMRHADEPMA